MVVNQFQIVNNDNSTGIKFHWADAYGDSITINNISVQQPGASASSNYSRNWGGFKRLISVDFVLFSDGSTDKSTDGSTKITLSQQQDHLMDTVVQGNNGTQSDVTYTVTIYRDGATKTFTGSLEDISIRASTSESNMLRGSLNLFEGT